MQLIRPNGEPVLIEPARRAGRAADRQRIDHVVAGRQAHRGLVAAWRRRRIALWIVDPASPKPYRKLLDLPAGVFTRGITWSSDGKSLILGTYRWSGDIFLAERSAPR